MDFRIHSSPSMYHLSIQSGIFVRASIAIVVYTVAIFIGSKKMVESISLQSFALLTYQKADCIRYNIIVVSLTISVCIAIPNNASSSIKLSQSLSPHRKSRFDLGGLNYLHHRSRLICCQSSDWVTRFNNLI